MPSEFQSALHPGGPQAAQINTLWWFLLLVAAFVFVAFAVTLFFALRRGHFNASPPAEPKATSSNAVARQIAALIPEPHPSPARERRLHLVIGGAAGASAVILVAFLLASYLTGRGIATIVGQRPVVIRVTGHQWWWDVQYVDADPSKRLRTANEINIPAGRPVILHLTSNDVIHSFWVPNLAGKKDLIPGYTTITWMQADRPGVYRAQCAEFCGHQHAKMALLVVAHTEDGFQRWLAGALAPAAQPRDSVSLRGRTVFETGTCAMCHAIAGTIAGSRVGPDLTHIGSRRTLAAGTLPNTTANLAGWILDPQRIKPGSRMPPQPLSAGDLRALLAYLEWLQ